MFYFYGRKNKIANLYPKPIYDTIIEPFSGAAAYSMLYYDRNVILCDIDTIIYKTWNYIISVDSNEILNLPLLEKGESLNNDKFNYLTEEQKYLIGFFLNPGSAQPKKSPGNFCNWNDKNRRILSENVNKVKHWKIINGSYKDIENVEATWFIDPPYSMQGKWYRYNNSKINYNDLGIWCKERNGQVIVCEHADATWMDFKPLISLKGQKHKKIEGIWTK